MAISDEKIRGDHEVTATPRGVATGEGGRIVCEGLAHDFVNPRTGESTQALDYVDLVIESGEFLTVVGPSGCGKSTLLKAIAGLIKPTHGQVSSDGVVVHGPGKDRGVVFQDLAILPWRSVRRNIAHGLEVRRPPPNTGNLLRT